MHYWNAAPDNWVPGAEQYAKGWIECFHAYQGLGPPATHWPIEHFQKYSEDDLMKDVFEDGYVDVAIFQPTYLKEWYKEGFNTTERNALMGEKHPGKFIYNTRWDPRDGDAGLEELKKNVDRFGSKGCKLYSAEWNAGSRGWKLTDPAAYRYLEECQRLGVKNIHVHKGPTIWPLDKDAFDVSDVDHAATDFQDLNFIVEHARRPRGVRRRARGARGLGGMTNPVTAGSPSAPPGESPPGAARVLAALDAVRDPELDEPITSLGFVSSCTVSADGDAQVRLRL